MTKKQVVRLLNEKEREVIALRKQNKHMSKRLETCENALADIDFACFKTRDSIMLAWSYSLYGVGYIR